MIAGFTDLTFFHYLTSTRTHPAIIYTIYSPLTSTTQSPTCSRLGVLESFEVRRRFSPKKLLLHYGFVQGFNTERCPFSLQLLSTLQTLESDMQTLQDNIHKLLDLIEDFSYTWLLSVIFLHQAKETKVLQHVVLRALLGGLATHLTTFNRW